LHHRLAYLAPSLAADAALGLYGWRGMPEALRDRLAAEATAIMAKPPR